MSFQETATGRGQDMGLWTAITLAPEISINRIFQMQIQGNGRFCPENSILGTCIKPINQLINKNIVTAISLQMDILLQEVFTVNISCLFCFFPWPRVRQPTLLSTEKSKKTFFLGIFNKHKISLYIVFSSLYFSNWVLSVPHFSLAVCSVQKYK